MGLFERRPSSPVTRLMAAAGLPTAGGEMAVPAVVMEIAGRGRARAAATLDVAEDLLGEPGDATDVALDFIEDLQNVASHRVDGLLTAEELVPLRGPRTVAAWE